MTFDILKDGKEYNRANTVLTFSPLSRILELYSEENALDDTMYYLGEALRREKVELDVFLKVNWFDVCGSYVVYSRLGDDF